MSELLSVIVPVYNTKAYLGKCVQSICNQTYENLEIILVDDGSPDNCGKICDEYAKKDNSEVLVISAKVEQELTELDPDDRKIFLELSLVARN